MELKTQVQVHHISSETANDMIIGILQLEEQEPCGSKTVCCVFFFIVWHFVFITSANMSYFNWKKEKGTNVKMYIDQFMKHNCASSLHSCNTRPFAILASKSKITSWLWNEKALDWDGAMKKLPCPLSSSPLQAAAASWVVLRLI